MEQAAHGMAGRQDSGAYAAPLLSEVGRWEVVTLVQSVVLGPGTFGLPFSDHNSGR